MVLVLLLALTACGQASGPETSGATDPGVDDREASGTPTAGTGTVRPSAEVPSPEVVTGGAPGSTVRGTYRESEQDSGTGEGVAGVTVGLYTESFLPGANAMSGTSGAGGRLVDETVTNPHGAFVLTEVPSGKWFVVASDARAATSGVWVRVTAEAGVLVDLSGCTSCPVPQ